jgi:hypothetical protein
MLLIFGFTLFLTLSCAGTQIPSHAVFIDGKYDSGLPDMDSSRELRQISRVIKKIYSTVVYENHSFSRNRNLTRESINITSLDSADEVSEFRNTVLGTGTVLHNRNNRIAVLTCAHIFDKPDTVVTYYGESGNLQRIVRNVAIKRRQINLIPDLPGGGSYEILVSDRKKDIAILGKQVNGLTEKQIDILPYPFGSASELDWGTFVYVFGFPRGYQVVTRALVSKPDKSQEGEFLLDASFNRGMSGGLVLAIRDGLPNIEIVGVTKSAAAEDETFLIPDPDKNYEAMMPYDGPVYTNTRKRINYGITTAVSSESILQLLQDNHELLKSKGYLIEAKSIF